MKVIQLHVTFIKYIEKNLVTIPDLLQFTQQLLKRTWWAGLGSSTFLFLIT